MTSLYQLNLLSAYCILTCNSIFYILYSIFYSLEKTLKLSAIAIANQLDIRGIKSFFKLKPLVYSSTELLHGFENDKYQYYFSYGVVVFASYSEEEIRQAVEAIRPYQKSPIPNWAREDHEIRIIPGREMEFEINQLIVDHLDAGVVGIAMFNLAQSLALEKYHETTENLLTEVKNFSIDLEDSGRIKISRKNMLRFIGKSLNTQNEIADNIYIFDSPELVWDDEYLDSLHRGFMKHFDLRVRLREIQYTIRIIEDNLAVFLEISNQRQSSTLEWIIIIMILVELINMFYSKIF